MNKKYELQIGENNPILRARSQEIDCFDEDIKNFCNFLLDSMYKYDGVGLAAPQMGNNIRIVATTQWKKNKMIKDTIMINPKIIEKSDKTIVTEEACLSIPNFSGDVKRSQIIKVEYQNIKGNKIVKKYKNFDAVVIQHEIDHLDGILYIDKLL